MRNLLVVVDMQNDFIDGSLGTKEAVAIVDNVVAEIAKYDTKDIFATRDTHLENYLETQEEFWEKGLPTLKEGDTILLKASRSREFEKTVAKLQGVN